MLTASDIKECLGKRVVFKDTGQVYTLIGWVVWMGGRSGTVPKGKRQQIILEDLNSDSQIWASPQQIERIDNER